MPESTNVNATNASTAITVVGAGLVGSLLAIFLSRRGFNVELFERRPDMRQEAISAGRSINLAVSTRGLKALRQAGLEEEILKQAIPMRGRMIHSLSGELVFQPYGKDDTEYINSISRGGLNKSLMTHAQSTGRVKINFNSRAVGMDLTKQTVTFVNETTRQETEKHIDVLIGTDGSASAIREALMTLPASECSQSYLDYGYKELLIPPDESGDFRLEKNALHIWPRGTFMLIALPNFDGSFTCTLFLPFEGIESFENLQTEQQVMDFFNEQFPDAIPLMPTLIETFFSNPTGSMVTVKCFPWHYTGKVLLVGDAAHAIVPFFGQGMNCGFEDLSVLSDLMDEQLMNGGVMHWSKLFEEFSIERKGNCDAIADMAVENFIEMRDKVANPSFLMEKAVEKILQKAFPGEYVSRYALVTFSNSPYKLALEAGIISDEILRELCQPISTPEQVDLDRAAVLIRRKLSPLLKSAEALNKG